MNFPAFFRRIYICSFLMILVSASTSAQEAVHTLKFPPQRHPYRTVNAGAESYLVVEGYENIGANSFTLPHRSETMVFDGAVTPVITMRITQESAPVAAHPFFYTEYRYNRDSTLTTALVSIFPQRARRAPNAAGTVFDVRMRRSGRTTIVTFRVPVVRWDEAARTTRVIEGYDLTISGAPAPRLVGSRDPDAVREAVAAQAAESGAHARSAAAPGVPSSYVKFFVRNDGLYKLDQNWMTANGVPIAGIDPGTIRLYLKGREVPMGRTGLQDGTFDPSDYLVFYGEKNYGDRNYRRVTTGDEGMPFYMDKYGDSSAYILAWGTDAGAGYATPAAATGAGSDTLAWFTDLARYETSALLHFTGTNATRGQIPAWTSEDTWHMGWIVQQATWNATLALTNLYPGISGHALFKTSSWFVQAGATPPAHNIAIAVNNSPLLDSVTFNRDEQAIIQGDVAPEFLVNGNNVFSVVSLKTGFNNQVNPIWVEIEYPRALLATDNALNVPIRDPRTTGFRAMRATGFTDTTGVVVRLRNGQGAFLPRIWRYDGATWNCIVTDTLALGDRILFANPASMPAAPAARPVTQAGLRGTQNSAEYLFITTRAFAGAAKQYTDFVGAHYGVSTMVVYVEDIYEEFSDGFFNPEAIKAFLQYATTSWAAPKPVYAVLAGDANYNYRAVNVPYPQNFVPAYGFPVGDGWMAQLDTASTDMMLRIGRIPARTEADLLLYLNKHRDYVNKPYTDWNKRYIFFSGGKPASGESEELHAASTRISTEIVEPAPIAGVTTQFYKTMNPTSDFGPVSGQEFLNILAKGAMIISYLGHSGTQTWDNSIGDPAQLNNAVGRSPFVMDFGCSTGRFAEPEIVCFAELFVLDKNSQAIGYIGNSAQGFVALTNTLPYLFMESILKDSLFELGAAHQRAKQKLISIYGASLVNQIAVQTNTLFCDPIIRLPVPPKPNLVLEQNWPRLLSTTLTERNDSVRVRLPYGNYGRVTNDSLQILIEDRNTDSVLTVLRLKAPQPAFIDTLEYAVPIRGISGNRIMHIVLDPDNRIDEIYENDNAVNLSYTITSGSLQALDVRNEYASTYPDSVTILNPVFTAVNPQTVRLEVDANPLFTQPTTRDVPYGLVYTRIKTPPPPPGGVASWRASIDTDPKNHVGPFRSFTGGAPRGWMQADSVSFARNQFVSAGFSTDGIRISNRYVKLRIISAGWYDGNFSVIEKDGMNVLPNSVSFMYSIAVFDSVSLELKRQRQFSTWGNRSAAESLAVELTRIDFGEIVAIATSDEPYRNVDLLLPGFHALGSKYIDSVATNDSWSMLSHKGAAANTAHEMWTRKITGKAVIDSTFYVVTTRGSIVSEPIGPAQRWRQLHVSRGVPPGAELRVTVFGRKSGGGLDSLFDAPPGADSVSLASIDAAVYPSIQLRADMHTGQNADPPVLRSWSVDYTDLPELAMNSQSVKVVKDSVDQGIAMPVSIGVVNPGPSMSGAFSIDVEALDRNNRRSLVRRLDVAGLAHDAWYTASVDVPTAQMPGANQVIVTIDPQNAVREQFKNNNTMVLPFFVKGDTTRPYFDVSFDGSIAIDMDYIRPKPDVRIHLFDKSELPVSDPNNFIIYLDDTLITKLRDPSITIQPGQGDEKAMLAWSPSLAAGEHIFKFNVRDANGNLADSTFRIIHLLVEGDAKVLNFYNYPNPFKDYTDFTFSLTGMAPPDEFHIKVYTVAGRLIRDINVQSSMLRIGFNAIRWDGLDEDHDKLANGVYFIKVMSTTAGKTEEMTGKISVLR